MADIYESGAVKISDDVVAIISGIATGETDGVVSMASGGGIADLLGGKKNVSKGVKVDITENDVTIDIHVVLQYGIKMPDVAWNIQEKVKEAVETMTGLNVLAVNVHIDGVSIGKDTAQTEEAE